MYCGVLSRVPRELASSALAESQNLAVEADAVYLLGRAERLECPNGGSRNRRLGRPNEDVHAID